MGGILIRRIIDPGDAVVSVPCVSSSSYCAHCDGRYVNAARIGILRRGLVTVVYVSAAWVGNFA